MHHLIPISNSPPRLPISTDTHAQESRLNFTASSSVSTRKAVDGALWIFLAFATSKLLAVLTNIFLARLLSPHDFGTVAFAMLLIGAFTLVQDLGLSASIVHSKRDIRELAPTALTLNVIAALLLL